MRKRRAGCLLARVGREFALAEWARWVRLNSGVYKLEESQDKGTVLQVWDLQMKQGRSRKDSSIQG